MDTVLDLFFLWNNGVLIFKMVNLTLFFSSIQILLASMQRKDVWFFQFSNCLHFQPGIALTEKYTWKNSNGTISLFNCVAKMQWLNELSLKYTDLVIKVFDNPCHSIERCWIIEYFAKFIFVVFQKYLPADRSP